MTDHRVLLINPIMTSRRSARFPLSLLHLAAALENKWWCRIIDGNIDRDLAASLRRALDKNRYDAVGISVMGGPQVRSAIDASRFVRENSPGTPIVWGGYFPTLYTSAALNAAYVDYAVLGPGEAAFVELLEVLAGRDSQQPGAADSALACIRGLAWKRGDTIVFNPDRAIAHSRPQARRANPSPDQSAPLPALLPYHLLGEPQRYLVPTFLGKRTAAHQAALGCRFRCTFCGVAAMFRGATLLPPAARLERDIGYLKNHLGADSIQYFDHNFFDRNIDMEPLLKVLAQAQLPWWCYARADALLNMPAESWRLVRASKLRMAYIGAESPSDVMLKSIRKGTRADQTLAVAELCRSQGVIPEFSFMVAPPHDPEGETERTFEFIREVKRVNPAAEIIVYVYTPLPAESRGDAARPSTAHPSVAADPLLDLNGCAIQFPRSPEGWTEPHWVDYACHADAPWLTDRLRRRIRSFVTVLGCRFPTVQDVRSPPLLKASLSALAAWRYRYRHYDRPWELRLVKKLSRPVNPQASGI